MRDNTIISLQVLLLNDLLRINVIDKEVYDMALRKIETLKKEKQAA